MRYPSLSVFWSICRLQQGPQDVPYAPRLLLGLAMLHVGVDLLMVSMEQTPLLTGLFRSLVNVVFMTAFVFAVLQVAKKTPRFVQSLSALIGAEVIIGMFGLVLLLLYYLAEALRPMVGFVWLMLLFWNMLIAAHIFRHALQTSMLWGVLLAVLYLFLAFNITAIFVTPAEAAA